MKEIFERLYKSMKAGLDTAHSYIYDDMEAICDDTFEGYAKSTLDELDKSIEAARDMHGLMEKKMPLFLDALTDISVNVGWNQLTFEDSRQRNNFIRQWAEEFVAIHDNTDWEQTDYILTIDEFAAKKLEEYKKHDR